MDPLMSSSGLDRFRGNTNSHEISATAASDTAHIANNHAYAVTINNNNPDLSSAAVASPRQQQQQQLRGGVVSACVVREQDQYMPIANVIRIMRRILPPHAKISDDAKETVQECVSEYISFITGEANERCQREQRKTVTAEDVLFAMSKLGFDNYVEPLSVFLRKYREAEGTDRMASSLFAKREKGDHVGMISMEYAHGAIPPGHYGGPPTGHYGGPPTGHYGGPPTGYAMAVPQSGMYHEGAMGGYYRDGGVNGGGSSSSPQGQPQGAVGGGGFDPFAQFK